MDEAAKQRRHSLLNDLVSLETAVVLAFYQRNRDRGPTATEADDLAFHLGQIATLYSISEDRNDINVLAPDQLRGARFISQGRELQYRDGRPNVTGLALTRSDLKKAIAALGY